MPESPWTAEGSVVDRQWDFNNVWMGGRRYWPGVDGHIKVLNPTLQTFCTVDNGIAAIQRREQSRVVGWVGFLSDVIGGVERALWEGCYPASALAHGVCVLVYV
jgi:hypothetical protein